MGLERAAGPDRLDALDAAVSHEQPRDPPLDEHRGSFLGDQSRQEAGDQSGAPGEEVGRPPRSDLGPPDALREEILVRDAHREVRADDKLVAPVAEPLPVEVPAEVAARPARPRRLGVEVVRVPLDDRPVDGADVGEVRGGLWRGRQPALHALGVEQLGMAMLLRDRANVRDSVGDRVVRPVGKLGRVGRDPDLAVGVRGGAADPGVPLEHQSREALLCARQRCGEAGETAADRDQVVGHPAPLITEVSSMQV